MRKYIQLLLPPFLFNLLKAPFSKKAQPIRNNWRGDYGSWDSALGSSGSYDGKVIFEKVKDATSKVLNGVGKFERDSVIFNQAEYSWPLLSCLLTVASSDTKGLNIVDFGGSLGSSFIQHRPLLEHIENINWCIVEQKHFVEYGRENIKLKGLSFYSSIGEIPELKSINCILLSSVLQYLPTPYEYIKDIVSYGFQYIIIDRTGFIESDRERLTVQKVPKEIYDASYPTWFFNRQKFINAFTGYEELFRFKDLITPPTNLEDGSRVKWEGIFLKKISR